MTDQPQKTMNLPRHPAVWRSRIKLRWPFGVWIMALAAAVILFYHGGEFGGMSGMVEVIREDVAPLETARLKSVEVIVGQHVRKGDVLATMDTTILDSETAVERLQIERQFATAVGRTEADLRDLRIRQAESAGELEVLNAEVARLDDLLKQHMVDAQTVAGLRARQQALARAVEFYPGMIESLEGDLARMKERQGTAEVRMGAATDASGSGLPPDLASQLESGRSRLGLLDLRREAYVLRASADGTVSEIFHEVGGVVQAGLPVMMLVLDRAQQIIGFLPEANARQIKVGMTAYISRTSSEGPVIKARVTALLPEIVALPTRVRPVPALTYRGRRVVLVPLEKNDFLPGEDVSIALSARWFSRLFSRPEPMETASSGGER